ncbi:MAG: PglZ domain-containing protein [Paenibacillus sp.]|nr:PglZ domain-containing protein [Paenibacillus sp.]
MKKLLWADDEIDLLKPHIMLLKAKGYDVATCNSGDDALQLVTEETFDLIFLDENMPGLSGLETLRRIKAIQPHIPVVMVTKSEEEDIMDQAVGSKIADYLIKPVNPKQVLSSIKKILHGGELVSEKTGTDYRQDFTRISSMINSASDITDWMELYRQLAQWDIELAATDSPMGELLAMQRAEAESAFAKYVSRNYESWITRPDSAGRPLLSPEVFKERVFPLLDAGEKVFFILIDNFRLDQWMAIKPLLADTFTFCEEMYCSILPTATQYARNAIFSGLMPADIARMFPELWVDEDSPEGKNVNESPLIATHFERYRRKCRFSYNKINDSAGAEKLLREFPNLMTNDLNVIVLNFIDMLSHARTESRMIRELASTDAAYRSLTESWFRHSPAIEIFRAIASRGGRIILTTDHGTVKVNRPVKVVGDRNTNTNLRYKVGKNLDYNPREVYEIRQPARFGLPAPNVSSAYIFATAQDFLAYPNNYNHYAQYYDGTFQHGGISLQEMLVPIVTLTAK